MFREELPAPRHKYEWTDIEFKEAVRAAHQSACEPVSAFANTAGGRLVFGVRYGGELFEQNSVCGPDLERVECRPA